MPQTFRDIEIKILSVTNDGLDIIQTLYPQATDRKNFRIRDPHEDKTESASMKLLEINGVRAWRVTDWGGSVAKENCFGLYALDRNISYVEAVLELANDYQAKGHDILETKKVIYKPEYRECKPEDFEHELNEKDFHFITKDFTSFELGLLGPEIKSIESENGNYRSHLVTPEHCKEVNLYSLEEYSYLSKDKTKVITYRSTENFPILGFVNTDETIGQWVKIYKPRAGKKFTDDGKDYRFHHLGGRPKDFIFGLDRLEKLMQTYRKSKEDEVLDTDTLKLPRITIATGGSDGLNFLAIGEPVVWFNSETQKIDKFILNKLKYYAEEIVNVPDCDPTGKREGRDLALTFMEVRTLWLDTYFRNKHHKDFKDFAKENQSLTLKQLTKRVGDMLDTTMPAKFWTSSYNEKGKKWNHNFSPTFAFYFLRLNGYCRVLDKSRKDGYYFAKVTGNVVEEVDVTEIKNFFKAFLIEKQKKEGVREISHSLMDSLITTPRFSDASMAMLHDRELDFSDFDQDGQYFFIGNKVYKTAKNGTEQAVFNRYVLKSQLLDELIHEGTGTRIDTSKFKIAEKPFFDIKEIGPDSYDITIHEENCEFLNYMIQTSRVHWDKDRKGYIAAGKSDDDFFKESKFKIAGKYLDEIDNHEQAQHVINKIWTFGYMLHRYKDPTRPLAPFAVDEAVMEDDVAEGGAGKTIYMDGAKFFCNVHQISGKEDFENDKFLLEGVSEHTDLLFFDDLKRNFDLSFFYQMITGDLTVNTKFMSKIKIARSLSPKFLFTSNYSLRDQRGSSIRRRVVTGFSDYYHAESEERSKREPKDDFNGSLFDDWNDAQWFKFMNFGFQCLAFYLGTKKQINAPKNNIMMRTYYIEMGEHFQQWADNKLFDRIDTDLVKDYLYKEMLDYAQHNRIKFLQDIKPTTFKKKLKAWCRVNDYELEDRKNINVLQYDEQGNEIMKNGKHYEKTMEHVRFFKHKHEDDNIQPGQYY